MKTAIFRKSTFNAAHRLHNPAWDDRTNREVFGKCNNPNYHGHNYEFIVRLSGDINPETGYVMDIKVLNDIMQEEIVDRFDHKNLNLDTPEFKHLNPTAEHIARIIYELLRKRLDPALELQITLYETPRNYVMYPA